MELREIITGKDIEKAACTKSIGNPPAQTVDFDTVATSSATLDTGENFYGDEGYDLDELDSAPGDEGGARTSLWRGEGGTIKGVR